MNPLARKGYTKRVMGHSFKEVILKKILRIFFLFLFPLLMGFTSRAAEAELFLIPAERPADIEAQIANVFKDLSRKKTSGWGLYNGQGLYGLLEINEHKAMKQLILDQYPEKKTFYALELGAGDFAWEGSLAEYLNAQDDLPKDIVVNIIGTRIESNVGVTTVREGICALHLLGPFEGNYLKRELEKHGFKIEGQVDLIMTRWALRHFADPLGTFVQAYDLLQPGQGLFFFDGFIIGLEDKDKSENYQTNESNRTLLRLLVESDEEFLVERYNRDRSFNRYVLRRTKPEQLKLPLTYVKFHKPERIYSGAGGYSVFRLNPGFHLPKVSNANQSNILYGSEPLFKWFLRNKLLYPVRSIFPKAHTPWFPLFVKDDERSYGSLYPLHEAIRRGDRAEVERLVAGNHEDINKIDVKLRTPLAFALEKEQREIAVWLAQQGADFHFRLNVHQKTPLVLAEEKGYDEIVALAPPEEDSDSEED